MDSYNFMTPSTETETRYYWFQLRNIRPDDAELSAMMSADVRHAFEEDRAVLNAVQIGLRERPRRISTCRSTRASCASAASWRR